MTLKYHRSKMTQNHSDPRVPAAQAAVTLAQSGPALSPRVASHK
jgi:hypothetical protein